MELVQLSGETLRALADGDLAAAEAGAPVPLSDYLAGPECRSVWEIRAVQVVVDPPSAGWITRVVWDPDRQLAVGRAGFHGPPDERGMVEVGYGIDPAHRRRGYAGAALGAMLQRVAAEPDVTVVRAAVSPENTASLRVVRRHGFVPVGEQIDEVDGLAIVHELRVRNRGHDGGPRG
ncbi:GNAT family N-acetyltransferase [Blastococcus sp. TF02-8]|nr:GNAT family N-acetyltransferase [Blastococcus sp. TF02-8]